MTDAKTRARLVDLSVIATAALVLGGSALVVAEVDGSRPRAPSIPEIVSYELVPEPATPERPAATTAKARPPPPPEAPSGAVP